MSYYLFEANGIYFDELIDILINNAMKKDYKKPILEITSFSSTVIALNEVSKTNEVLNFTDNQGEVTTWEEFFN